MNETLKMISQRYSCRDYQDTTISEDELVSILNAAIQAPSAMNRQLCEVFSIANKKIIDELAAAIIEVSVERGDEEPIDRHFTYHAPVLVIVSGPEYDNQCKEDGSCMLENIFLAATSLQIGSCWINQLKDTQDIDIVRNFLTRIGIPVNHKVIGCAALGYANDTPVAKLKNQERIHIIK